MEKDNSETYDGSNSKFYEGYLRNVLGFGEVEIKYIKFGSGNTSGSSYSGLKEVKSLTSKVATPVSRPSMKQ